MKRKLSILVLILAVLMCFFSVSAFAISEENGNSQMPFVDSDQIVPRYPEIQTEDEMMEEFDRMFGEKGKIVFIFTICSVLFAFLFFPCLVTVIVFGILNSKTKKKIREYEKLFGAIPQNSSRYNNLSFNNNPYYRTQPVNTMNSPMGTLPSENSYIPENDPNKRQGGQM